jgi:hypothetical protein
MSRYKKTYNREKYYNRKYAKTYIPKEKRLPFVGARLIGHEKHYDIYEKPSGQIWHYSGSKLIHWTNHKYWKRVT